MYIDLLRFGYLCMRLASPVHPAMWQHAVAEADTLFTLFYTPGADDKASVHSIDRVSVRWRAVVTRQPLFQIVGWTA